MKDFSELIQKIEQTKSTKEKIFYIQHYFNHCNESQGAWALFFLCGHRIKRFIGPSKLWEWCQEATELPEWIAQECYFQVGDLAETIALLLGKQMETSDQKETLSEWMEQKILPLAKLDKAIQKERILLFWKELDRPSLFILNKILTGSLRIGVSKLLTIKALSQAIGVSKELLSQRLMGQWVPSASFFANLKLNQDIEASLNPYPFYLASPLQEPLEKLGNPEKWAAEWKWDGIRAQCIIRKEQTAIWSRGNELITEMFPEIVGALKTLPKNSILDGELLAFDQESPLPFSALQKRLGRKKVTEAMIASVPIIYMIYDILEYRGEDVRQKTFLERRALFERFSEGNVFLKTSPLIAFTDWETLRLKRDEAPKNRTEGLMLKKVDSPYLTGRIRGKWWKFKVDPKTIDAILLYAQPGNGWRANLYTDYTFGVWHQESWVPIAKAYSGLSMEEIVRLDRWIRKNTVDKFGPVRQVKPECVFEIAFEGMQLSKRHKSGVSLRFPRIVKWRLDKPIGECDTLDGIKEEFLNT